MDKAIDEVNLSNVVHIRAHPRSHQQDTSFFIFEVHFTCTGEKGTCPSPWQLRAFTLVGKLSLCVSVGHICMITHQL